MIPSFDDVPYSTVAALRAAQRKRILITQPPAKQGTTEGTKRDQISGLSRPQAADAPKGPNCVNSTQLDIFESGETGEGKVTSLGLKIPRDSASHAGSIPAPGIDLRGFGPPHEKVDGTTQGTTARKRRAKQLDLFVPADPLRFDGETYDAHLDRLRLSGQHRRVATLMGDGQWRTLDEIAALTEDPPASVSARLRDFRKVRFGRYTVERRRVGAGGLYQYRIDPDSSHATPAAPPEVSDDA